VCPGQVGEDIKDLPGDVRDQLAPLLQALDLLTVVASSIVSASNDGISAFWRSMAVSHTVPCPG